MALWAVPLLNRVAVKSYGKTVFEHTAVHGMKTPLCASGEAVVWRRKRHSGSLSKWNRELADGMLLDVSGMGSMVLVQIGGGIVKTQDFRRSPDGRCNAWLVSDMKATSEEYICPTATPDPIVVHVPDAAVVDSPEAADAIPTARRMRLMPRDSNKRTSQQDAQAAFSYSEEAEYFEIMGTIAEIGWMSFSRVTLKVEYANNGRSTGVKSK